MTWEALWEALNEAIARLIIKRRTASIEEQDRLNIKLDKLYKIKDVMMK